MLMIYHIEKRDKCQEQRWLRNK